MNTRVLKKVQKKTPSGMTIHYRKRRVGYALCGRCGEKLNRGKVNLTEIRKLSKAQRRSERPFPNLCSRCMREVFKEIVRK